MSHRRKEYRTHQSAARIRTEHSTGGLINNLWIREPGIREELSRGNWSGGYTTLSIHDENGELNYELESVYDDSVETDNPPTVDFHPEELRELIHLTREKLNEDPFLDGSIKPLAQWYKAHGEGVLAEASAADGSTKQFRMKWNDDADEAYLKIQKISENGGNLHDSPTLGPDEFKGVFGSLTVL